jgi:hypothetical protein
MEPAQTEAERARRYRDVGGTAGGLGEFLMGLVLLGIGGYLLLNHVVVSSGGIFFGRHFAVGFGLGGGGPSPFAIALLLLLIGIALLFFNGRSVAGWALIVISAGAIVVGIIADLNIYFQPATLLVTIVMFGMMAAGLGLIVRGLRPH